MDHQRRIRCAEACAIHNASTSTIALPIAFEENSGYLSSLEADGIVMVEREVAASICLDRFMS